MEISGNKIIFEGTPIATIDGGWPTLVERFTEKLLDNVEDERFEILERENDRLKDEIQDLRDELDKV